MHFFESESSFEEGHFSEKHDNLMLSPKITQTPIDFENEIDVSVEKKDESQTQSSKIILLLNKNVF